MEIFRAPGLADQLEIQGGIEQAETTTVRCLIERCCTPPTGKQLILLCCAL